MLNKNFHRAEFFSHFAKPSRDLFRVRDIRGNCHRLRAKLSAKFANELGRAGEHPDAAAFLRQLPYESASQSGADPGNDRHASIRLLDYAFPISDSRVN